MDKEELAVMQAMVSLAIIATMGVAFVIGFYGLI